MIVARRMRHGETKYVLDYVPFRRDHVRNLGRALEMEPSHLLLQHAVRIGDAFVLTQMLEPGFDQERLDERAGSAASSNTPHA